MSWLYSTDDRNSIVRVKSRNLDYICYLGRAEHLLLTDGAELCLLLNRGEVGALSCCSQLNVGWDNNCIIKLYQEADGAITVMRARRPVNHH